MPLSQSRGRTALGLCPGCGRAGLARGGQVTGGGGPGSSLVGNVPSGPTGPATLKSGGLAAHVCEGCRRGPLLSVPSPPLPGTVPSCRCLDTALRRHTLVAPSSPRGTPRKGTPGVPTQPRRRHQSVSSSSKHTRGEDKAPQTGGWKHFLTVSSHHVNPLPSARSGCCEEDRGWPPSPPSTHPKRRTRMLRGAGVCAQQGCAVETTSHA